MDCRALFRAFAVSTAALAFGAIAQQEPPRNASDLLETLKVGGAGSRNQTSDEERALQTLAALEPATSEVRALFRHHMRRAHAQGVLGDRAAQKQELIRALQLTEGRPQRSPAHDSQFDRRNLDREQVLDLQYQALGVLLAFENDSGSLLTAREYANAQAEAARKMRLGQLVVPLMWQTLVANRLGDRPLAERAVAEMDSTIARLRRSPNWERFGHYWTSRQERARGILLNLLANPAAAEQAAQTALAEAESDLAQRAERAATEEQREAIASATGWIETVGRDLAGYQSQQGKLLAAELTIRRTVDLSLKRAGFASIAAARGLQGLAGVLVEQGRYADGEAIAREALRAAEATGLAGTSDILVQTREKLGGALALQARWGEAAQVYAEREQALKSADPELRKAVRIGSFNWALALIKSGQQPRARTLLTAMRARYESIGDAASSKRIAYARGFLGLSYVEAGEREKALAEFRASVPKILEAAYQDLLEERESAARIARMNYILEGYMRALADTNRARTGAVDRDAIAEIFRIADFARGSRVQRALSLGAGRAAARDPALLKLVEADERLRNRVTVLSGILDGLIAAPDDKRLDQVVNAMRADLAQIERERTAIRESISREFPDYASLIFPKPISIDDARKALRPGEALLSIYLAEDRAYAWGVTRDAEPAFALIEARRDDVTRIVAQLRKALDVGAAPLERLPAFDLALAHSLYARFVQPVESAVRSASTLLVAPHGALGQIPFALLPTASMTMQPAELRFAEYRDVPWLLRRHAVVQLPAVSSLLTLARAPAPPAGRRAFIGFGDPVFGAEAPAAAAARRSVALRNLDVSRQAASAGLAGLPPLPDTRDEVLGIARALGADAAVDVFLGRAASEKNVFAADLIGRRVVAFATHGLVPGDLDGLTQPALALSNPALSGETGDGLLTMEKILGLRFSADWVVLSACNTAAATGAGEEALSGLGRAFFFAGARALLASNWPVETVSARLLTTDLFRRQSADAKLTRAEALRQSMIHMLDNEGGRDASGKLLYSYAHPLFWAPFSLVGDGTGP